MSDKVSTSFLGTKIEIAVKIVGNLQFVCPICKLSRPDLPRTRCPHCGMVGHYACFRSQVLARASCPNPQCRRRLSVEELEQR